MLYFQKFFGIIIDKFRKCVYDSRQTKAFCSGKKDKAPFLYSAEIFPRTKRAERASVRSLAVSAGNGPQDIPEGISCEAETAD